MTPFEIGLIAIAALVLLVLIGLYVPIALIVCSFGAVWAILGSPDLAGRMLAQAVNETISNYYFGVIPLFVMMGFLVAESEMGQDAYDVANGVFRKLPGGLAYGTVGANTIFAAITGISIASAAVFTRVAVPEMLRHGYTHRFTLGLIAGSSVLGMLLPPSLLLIIYGALTEQSVGDLFIAGIMPGLLLAVLICVGVALMIRLVPAFVGAGARRGTGERLPTRELITKLVPIVLLIVAVIGGIYSGLLTPVEAGAAGCIGALVLGLARRKLSWVRLRRVLFETGLITASICFLIMAAQLYSRMLAFSQVPQEFGNLTTGADMGFMMIMLAYVVVIILLGMILDSSSILLIMVPIVLPIMISMQVDLIWFGIVTIIAVEIGLLTPPLGISVMVIKATLDDPRVSLNEIFHGAFPFVLVMLVTLALVVAFPVIAVGLLGRGF